MKSSKVSVTGLKATFLWTGIQVFIKVLSGLVMGKVIAVTVGPSGLALIGQFQNFYGICSSLASGSIGSGVVKYTAEYKFDLSRRKVVWRNSLYIHVFMSILVLFTIIIFRNDISFYFFKSSVSPSLLVFFSFTIFFSVLNLLFLSVINGLGDHRLFSQLNLFLSIYTMLLVSVGCVFFGVTGVISSFILSQSTSLFLTVFVLLKKYGRVFFDIELKKIDAHNVKGLFLYGLQSFVSGMSLSLTLLMVRNIILKDSSLDVVGYWEALWRFSVYYTMIGALPASIYYIPKYSGMKSLGDIKKSFWESVKYIIPFMIFVGFFVYSLRETIIELVFSKEFLVVAPIVHLIFFGDTIKVFNNLITNIMHAKKAINHMMFLEVSKGVLMVVLSFCFFPLYGVEGVVFSYIASVLAETFYCLFFYYKIMDRVCG